MMLREHQQQAVVVSTKSHTKISNTLHMGGSQWRSSTSRSSRARSSAVAAGCSGQRQQGQPAAGCVYRTLSHTLTMHTHTLNTHTPNIVMAVAMGNRLNGEAGLRRACDRGGGRGN